MSSRSNQAPAEPTAIVASGKQKTLPQRWVLVEPTAESVDNAQQLADSARIPQVLAELLIARGITTAATAFEYLNPDFNNLHDPFGLKGMAEAVVRLEAAIERHEPVLLYGDYDVDGTTAVVLLKTAIEMLGGEARFHVPHRLNEGYGLQSRVLEEAFAAGVRLVITVDTGMRAFAEAETAARLGLDLIITDHHLPDAGDALPRALAILNPNQPGCQYPEKSLCGAAIAMKLGLALLSRRHAERTHTKTLPSFLKLAAIATIADAVPLKGENRTIAALGLRELRNPVGTGLRALFASAAIDPTARAITGFDIGFRIGPRLNAAGRMDVASEVVELLTTRDSMRAADLAAKLERLNSERRDTEAIALKDIEARLESDPELTTARLVVVDGEGWHRGVIGILGSRVVERTAKPALVISLEDGMAHGSGRSIDGFHLLNALESCADLFDRFGGHAFAVGFAMDATKLPELKRRLTEYANIHLAHRLPEQILHIHAELPLDRITPVLAGWLKKMEPLGHGNNEPVFLARNVCLLRAPRVMKERHIRFSLAQHGSSGSKGASGSKIDGVGWNLAARATELNLREGSLINVAYKIRENDHADFGGLEVQLMGFELAE